MQYSYRITSVLYCWVFARSLTWCTPLVRVRVGKPGVGAPGPGLRSSKPACSTPQPFLTIFPLILSGVIFPLSYTLPPYLWVDSSDVLRSLIVIRGSKLTVTAYKQCSGSRMFIPDPDFFPSRIPYLGSKKKKKKKKRRGKKICCITW
jgi:hypothetical protein